MRLRIFPPRHTDVGINTHSHTCAQKYVTVLIGTRWHAHACMHSHVHRPTLNHERARPHTCAHAHAYQDACTHHTSANNQLQAIPSIHLTGPHRAAMESCIQRLARGAQVLAPAQTTATTAATAAAAAARAASTAPMDETYRQLYDIPAGAHTADLRAARRAGGRSG